MADSSDMTAKQRREALDASHAVRHNARLRRRIAARKLREADATMSAAARERIVSDRVRDALADATVSLEKGLASADEHSRRADAMIQKVTKPRGIAP